MIPLAAVPCCPRHPRYFLADCQDCQAAMAGRIAAIREALP